MQHGLRTGPPPPATRRGVRQRAPWLPQRRQGPPRRTAGQPANHAGVERCSQRSQPLGGFGALPLRAASPPQPNENRFQAAPSAGPCTYNNQTRSLLDELLRGAVAPPIFAVDACAVPTRGLAAAPLTCRHLPPPFFNTPFPFLPSLAPSSPPFICVRLLLPFSTPHSTLQTRFAP